VDVCTTGISVRVGVFVGGGVSVFPAGNVDIVGKTNANSVYFASAVWVVAISRRFGARDA
jgi:hypothetical protein